MLKPGDIIEKRLAAEAERLSLSVDEARLHVLKTGLDALRDQRDRESKRDQRDASVLVVTTTDTEAGALDRELEERGLAVTKSFGLKRFQGANGNRVAMGRIAGMGAFGTTGSSAELTRMLAETGATSAFLVGMCFGTRPERAGGDQRIGDVVVSEKIHLYDSVRVRGPGFHTLIQGETLRRRVAEAIAALRFRERGFECSALNNTTLDASAYWVNQIRYLNPSYVQGGTGFRLYFGTVLSGGQLVEHAGYRDWLVGRAPSFDSPVVGGEMEGAGLISNEVDWIVVKGICDFGDQETRAQVADSRALACKNAARVAIDALMVEQTT
jgi:nucleoside phosphorylase